MLLTGGSGIRTFMKVTLWKVSIRFWQLQSHPQLMQRETLSGISRFPWRFQL